MASKYLWVDGGGRRLDHFIPKFTNSIQHLVEVPMYCLYGPPKGLVDNPNQQHEGTLQPAQLCILLFQVQGPYI